MFVQELLLMVFGDLMFTTGMKLNKKQLEGCNLFQSSSSLPTHYLNNWNLSEEIWFYLCEKILLDPEIRSLSLETCSFQLW